MYLIFGAGNYIVIISKLISIKRQQTIKHAGLISFFSLEKLEGHFTQKTAQQRKKLNLNSSMWYFCNTTHVCIPVHRHTHTGVATLNNQRLFVSQWLPAALLADCMRSSKTRRKQPALIKHRHRRVYYTHKLCTRSYMDAELIFSPYHFLRRPRSDVISSHSDAKCSQQTDLDWHVSIKARRSTVCTCCFVSHSDTHLANTTGITTGWWRDDGELMVSGLETEEWVTMR